MERHAAPRLDPGKASRQFTNLVIDNIGRTVAHDVRFRFDPPIRTSMDDHGALGDSTLVREGMPTMAPGQRIEALFDFGPDRAETDLPDRYNVTVTLKDALRRDQEPHVIGESHVWIRNGLTSDELTRTVAHECHHFVRGRDEEAAQEFERTFEQRVFEETAWRP